MKAEPLRTVRGLARTRSSLIGLTVSLLLAGPAAAATQDELLAQIEALRAEQARVAELQAQIEQRLGSLEAGLRATQTRVPTGAVTEATAIPADEPSRLVVSGDMRVRGQGDYAEGVRDRLSAQARGRIAATYAANDAVTIGVRLVTGDPDDPNSSDVQLSNFDDDLQVSLDQAYVRLNFDDLSLFAGKMPQPFARTDLVWDGDVSPQGVSAMYRHRFDSGSALRANGLFFIIDESIAGPDSTMSGVQLGYDAPGFGDLGFNVSAAYYDYRLGSLAGADLGDFRTNLRNPDGSYLSDFELGDIIVSAAWTGAGDRWPVRLTADYVHNFGARTDQDTGYSIDLAAGRASKPHDWRLTYGYALAETDSVFAAFSHDNLALATNYELHSLTLDYVPLPRTLISAIWYHYRPHEVTAPLVSDDWIERVRLAFQVSF